MNRESKPKLNIRKHPEIRGQEKMKTKTQKPSLKRILPILALAILISFGLFAGVTAAPPAQDPTPQPSVELKGLVDPPDVIEANQKGGLNG